MAIGERIKFMRHLRGMTQKSLGMAVGFDERTADIRIAQYESGARTPKEKLTSSLASALAVSPKALTVPEIDSCVGLMHTLFTCEDLYGLKVGESDGALCLRLDKSIGRTYEIISEMLDAWRQQAVRLEVGEVTKDEYDKWRYRYPDVDTT